MNRYDKVQQAIDYYCKELKKSQVAKDYLKSRGITKESVIKFQLGYAPTDCKIASRFRNRIIFPIWDIYGRPIGWTGRTVSGVLPKYNNVKESAIFRKGRILYLYHIAKQAIAASGWAILVEGQMDALTLHQAGLINTVASSGTAFKESAANILARYAERVYTIFDADNAGELAKLKATKLLKSANVDVYTVTIPEGADDPDMYLRKYGKPSFMGLLKNAERQ